MSEDQGHRRYLQMTPRDHRAAPVYSYTAEMQGPDVLYMPRRILVDDTCNAEALKACNEELGLDAGEEQVTDGVFSIGWRKKKKDSRKVVEELCATHPEFAGSIAVDAVLVPNMIPSIGPAGDPLPGNTELLPLPAAAADQFQVAVVDTGFLDVDRQKHRVEGPADSNSPTAKEDPIKSPHDPTLIRYDGACHGAFISGIVARAPAAKVVSYNALVNGTETYMCDSSVLRALALAKREGAKAMVCSFGSYASPDPRRGLYPKFTEKFILGNPDILFVAAAGNDGSQDPWYPAALAAKPDVNNVVSVGALGSTPQPFGPPRAAYSNYGSWVEAWAQGAGVSDYARDMWFRYDDGSQRHFTDASAQWAGTSFAAPNALAALINRAAAAGDDLLVAWAKARANAPVVL